MDTKKPIIMKISEDDPSVAYVSFQVPGERKVAKNLRLFDLIGKYEGPDVIFDLDESGRLMGIEILTD